MLWLCMLEEIFNPQFQIEFMRTQNYQKVKQKQMLSSPVSSSWISGTSVQLTLTGATQVTKACYANQQKKGYC